jgi:hypothetical protein
MFEVGLGAVWGCKTGQLILSVSDYIRLCEADIAMSS